jgi:hypothetical protein
MDVLYIGLGIDSYITHICRVEPMKRLIKSGTRMLMLGQFRYLFREGSLKGKYGFQANMGYITINPQTYIIQSFSLSLNDLTDKCLILQVDF